MRWLLLLMAVTGWCCPQAQSFTGTWIATYHRNEPTDKRTFYYRLYLRHSNDSVFGICELLDARTDLEGDHWSTSGTIAKYEVYNYQVRGTDTSSFELYTGHYLTFPTAHDAIDMPPVFLKLKCKIETDKPEKWTSSQPMVSLSPASNGPTGNFTLVRILNTAPALDGFMMPAVKISRLFSKQKEKPAKALFSKKEKSKSEGNDAANEGKSFLSISQRKDEVQQKVEVENKRVIISLFDNGIVDNDTVSLYLNDRVLVSNQRLTDKALEIEVELDSKKENTFRLFAHNLGQLPPNTGIMVVHDGDTKHNLSLSSTLTKNAVVILKLLDRRPPAQ